MAQADSTTPPDEQAKSIRANVKIGRILAAISFATFLLILLTYFTDSNISAFFNIMPFWVFGLGFLLPGLMGWICFHSKWGLSTFALWAICLLFYSDFLSQLPLSPTPANQLSIPFQYQKARIITLSSDEASDIDIDKVKDLAPDIIFIETQHAPQDIIPLAFQLFGNIAQIKQEGQFAIITRGGSLEKSSVMNVPCISAEWQPKQDSPILRLVNVILTPRPNKQSFLNLGSITQILELQMVHRMEIQGIRNHLYNLNSKMGYAPTILGGDFNNPAHSLVFKQLKEEYTDCYSKQGRGYGATAPESFPLYRFQRIFTTQDIIPFQSFVTHVDGTLEKCVVTDLLYK